MNKPEVGQEIFVSTTGNRARYGVKTYQAVVTRVGRKFFDAKPDDFGLPIKFYIKSWTEKNDVVSNYKAWESEQDYKDAVKRNRLFDRIRKEFSGQRNLNKCSLADLEKIAEIIGVSDE